MYDNPSVEAHQVQDATRALAHTSRSVEDPRQIYSVLGSLTAAVASLSQTLHQLGAAHDSPTLHATWEADGSRRDRATTYRVSWELHRAAEMLNQVGEVIARAHNAEATITYAPRDPLAAPRASRRVDDPGLSL